MPETLPSRILEGASGIVGRSFLQAAQDRFLIYAIARSFESQGGADYVIHLAACDFPAPGEAITEDTPATPPPSTSLPPETPSKPPPG